MINCCMSGGATGADTLFGELAAQAGHEVIHWSFEGHKTKCDPKTVRKLSNTDLVKADKHLKRANFTLNRTFPASSEYVNNQLRRNFYQVVDSERIYAVCAFDKENKIPFGGTAWAVVMGINLGIPEVYVFDTVNDRWLTWDVMDWKEIENIPAPEGIYAGIGSRELPENGINAIRSLYNVQVIQKDKDF